MARIQITVPEAPKADAVYLGEARGGEISAPGVRFQEATNFERHIPGLMQPELSQAPYANLARAQSGIGAAIADAGQTVSGALGQLMQGMKESKDASDVSFANNTMRLTHAEFAERVANENIQPAQQIELWKSDYAPKINQALIDRQMSPDIIAEVAPKWRLFDQETRTGIAQQAQKDLIQAQETEIVNDIEASVKAGDWEGALDANVRLTLGHHQTPGQEAKRKRDILDAKQEFDLQQDLGSNPRQVLQEMEEIQATGTSDIYPDLKNPIVVNKWQDIARKEVNEREVDTLEQLRDAKGAGKLTKPEDVDRIAQGNLTADRVQAFKNELLHDPIYDKESVVTMRSKIASYNAEDDDAGMSKYFSLYEEIGTTVPSELQGPLRSDLYQEYSRKKEGKAKDTNKAIDAAIDSEIVKFAKAGMFDPEGYSSVEAEKDPSYLLKNSEQHLAVWTKVETYQRQLKEWRAAHPDASPEQISKQIQATVGADIRRNAKAAMDWRKMTDNEASFLPPAARKKYLERQPAPPTPAEIRQKLTPRYEFGRGMASIEGDDMPTSSGAINESLVSAVKGMEGFTSKAQWDFKQWSVGYGTKGKQGETLTQAQADARLRSELAMHAGRIDEAAEATNLRLTPGQRNALISFDFNTGRGAYLIRSSKGNPSEILRRLKLYVKADGKTLPGLVNRRNAEADMFLT